MRKLFTYLSDYKKESIIAPLFKMLEALFDLFVPLVVAGIINNGILKGDRTYIVRMCLVLILFAVVGMACAILAQYFAAKAAVGFSAKLRGALFAHIQKLSFILKLLLSRVVPLYVRNTHLKPFRPDICQQYPEIIFEHAVISTCICPVSFRFHILAVH